MTAPGLLRRDQRLGHGDGREAAGLEIDVEHVVPVALAHLEQRHARIDAGIVDQDVGRSRAARAASATIASMSESLATSALISGARRPLSRTPLATASAPAWSSSQFTATSAPSPARASAIAAPMPCCAPVTSATLPCNFIGNLRCVRRRRGRSRREFFRLDHTGGSDHTGGRTRPSDSLSTAPARACEWRARRPPQRRR